MLRGIDQSAVEACATGLADVRERDGRLFILGVGGSAAHASHAVNDFRKLCDIEAYAPTDNVSELTARINDEGWETVFGEWLEVPTSTGATVCWCFSVGGGDAGRGGFGQPGGGHGARSPREQRLFLPSWGAMAVSPRKSPTHVS